MSEYQRMKRKAEEKGWKMPQTFDVFGEAAWLNYWRLCAEHERNPDAGRPVVPHRSA